MDERIIMRKDFAHVLDLFDLEEQKFIYNKIKDVKPGFYTPVTKWGAAMNIQMNCLGRHWNAKNYTYQDKRVDADGQFCAPIPKWLHSVAKRAMKHWDESCPPFDAVICNFYDEKTGKLGLHQDNSETPEVLKKGYPILSLSIGADCKFQIGGEDKKDPIETMVLRSGDVVLFGRSKRLAYHGVSKIIPGTTPAILEMPAGRLNLTFRVTE
jgi:alkylated DNA repair protein (DNA oxidative demethylase)